MLQLLLEPFLVFPHSNKINHHYAPISNLIGAYSIPLTSPIIFAIKPPAFSRDIIAEVDYEDTPLTEKAVM
jgi:hypothetical protein